MTRDSALGGRVLKLREVIEVTGLKKSSIYERMKPGSRYFDPAFPARLSIGLRAVGWHEEEILRWLKSRAQHGGGLNYDAATEAKAPETDARAVEKPVASKERPQPLASSERDISRDAELVLAEVARAGQVVSLYQFLHGLRQRAGDNSGLPADQVLDAIDLAAYRKSKTLPSVLIQENGAPLERAKRLAVTLAVRLTKEEVMVQRQKLFLNHLRPTDPRPVGFRWIDSGRHRVMNPYYEAKRPVDVSPPTPDEKAQSDAMHARYAALVPNASSKAK